MIGNIYKAQIVRVMILDVYFKDKIHYKQKTIKKN